MTFFYDLNKKLADLAKKQELAESAQPVAERSTGDYSAKKASAGKDIGKPGKMFSKIAKSAGERYGSKAAGERVAGAVLNKLRAKESMEESIPNLKGHDTKYGVVVVGHNDGKPVKTFDNEADAKAFADKGIRVGGGLKQGSVRTIVAPKKKTNEASTDESALQAYLGKKKYGDSGMKALQKAGREGAGKEKMARIRAQHDKMDEAKLQPTPELMKKVRARLEQLHDEMEPEEAYEQMADELNISTRRLDQLLQDKRFFEADMEEGNEFSGELAQARAAGAKEFKVDGQSYPVQEDDVDDFIKAGGKVQYGKPQKGPRRPGLSFGSKHIGVAGGAGKASQISGRGANTGKSGKPVVAVEADGPMTPKQKSFAKLAPPADKITFADRIAGAKKEVDEMLGDVAAEAIKSAVAKKKEPRSKGTAFDPEVLKTMTATDPHPRYDVKDTGYSKRYTRKAVDTDVDAGDEVASDAPKKKGRPKGPEKGPERTTKGAWKHKGTRKEKADEDLDTDGVMMNTPSNMSSESVDSDEYDREGKSAKCDIKTIVRHAQALHKILGDDDNLPEWVQSKLAKIEGMMTSVDDYMQNQDSDEEEQPIAEKAVSKKQQRFMGMVHAAQKGEKPASKEVAKTAKSMGKKDAKDFAATKHKGLPEKKKKDESVEETTTAGSVATAPAEKKAKGGYNFGGSVYESLNKKYKQALTEGMNISVNMNTGQDGQPSKNITISADGDDADKLAELLKMAGMGGHGESQSCEACGKTPCGCESIDENSPDWPTSTEKIDADPNLRTYSGGLNGPKSTGQSTTPVLASQLRRQVSMEESAKLESNLFKLYQNYKAQ